MSFTETPVTTKTVYEGLIVNVRADKARLDNGKIVDREVVEHPGGVTVAAVTERGTMLAVRQFRYPFGEELLELPAGKLERGEDPLECAKRELSEETGYSAKNWVSLGKLYPSPGFCEEILYIYLATDLTAGVAHPDEDEFLSVCEVSFEQINALIASNSLPDAKTIVGAMKAERYLQNL